MTATYVPLRDSLDKMGLGAVFMLHVCAMTHTVTNCPEQTPHQTATYQPKHIAPHHTTLYCTTQDHFPSLHFTLIISFILVYGMTLHQLSKIDLSS